MSLVKLKVGMNGLEKLVEGKGKNFTSGLTQHGVVNTLRKRKILR